MRIDYGSSESAIFLRVVKAIVLVLLIGWGASLVLASLAKADTATPAATPAPKSKYRRSRLTSDESEDSADHRKLLLSAGEDKAVDIDFDPASANAISIGNPTILVTTFVRIGDKRQIVFKPLKKGETNVTIRDADGNIRLIFGVRVTDSSLLRMKAEILDMLRDVEGIDVRVVGPKVVVEGEVLTPTDFGRLLGVIHEKPYSDDVLNLATLSPIALTVIAKKIQDDVNSFAPNVRTRVVNGVIFLEGTVDDLNQAQRAARIAAVYLPPEEPQSLLRDKGGDAVSAPQNGRTLIQNFIVINPPPPKKADKLVRITVHFVELSKDYNKFLGFKWQPGFTAEPSISIGQSQTGVVTGNGASFSGTLSNLLPKLGSAETAGYARILRTGNVVVRSGQAAQIDEETDYPFLIPSGNGTPTAGSSKVGVQIGVVPQILGQSEDIQMDLKMKQINVVGRDPATGARPTTASQEVDTRLYIKSNESAAVAGFNDSTIGTDFNKDDPNAGSFGQNTDPLFTMLRSRAYRKDKSQMVIFVTPQIVQSASEGTEDLKKNFRVRVK